MTKTAADRAAARRSLRYVMQCFTSRFAMEASAFDAHMKGRQPFTMSEAAWAGLEKWKAAIHAIPTPGADAPEVAA